ncbi:MAG: hypothetical protein VB137_15800 [Burkholderia sp.]
MGDRFAALEPTSQGGREQFGSVEADAGRGLSLLANGVSKNWASRHPSKPVRHRSCHFPPDHKIVSKQPNPLHTLGDRESTPLGARRIVGRRCPADAQQSRSPKSRVRAQDHAKPWRAWSNSGDRRGSA